MIIDRQNAKITGLSAGPSGLFPSSPAGRARKMGSPDKVFANTITLVLPVVKYPKYRPDKQQQEETIYLFICNMLNDIFLLQEK